MIIGIVGFGFVGKATYLLKCERINMFSYDINPDLCIPKGITLSGTTFQFSGTHDSTLHCSGQISSGQDIIAFTSSDERLKDNKLVIENSLDKVGKLERIQISQKKTVYFFLLKTNVSLVGIAMGKQM